MKNNNILFLLLLCVFCFPFIVGAKENCTVVSGDGKTIGNEIACGTEHFYVIGKEDNKLKMLSKYNLYVGANFSKITINKNEIYEELEYSLSTEYLGKTYYFEGESYTDYDEWLTKIKEKYNISNNSFVVIKEYDNAYLIRNDKKYRKVFYKIYPYDSIDTNTPGYAMQNKLAIGVSGEKGNANYPIYATTNLFPSSGTVVIQNFENYKNGYTNFDFKDNSFIQKYLDDYKNNLTNNEYEIKNVDMLNIKDINNLVYAITNSYLPLEEWYLESLDESAVSEDGGTYKIIGDLKEYLSNDYKWLWSTSYWTKTKVNDSNEKVYFISTTGEICFADSCYNSIPRAGIRPVVTIQADSIKYLIRTKTDGNGTIEVLDSAFGGDSIQFKVTAKKGLKLTGLTITTDSGETIDFKNEDISSDSNGIYSISTNKFTMPFENVTIEARWESTNPKTGFNIFILVISIFIISSTTYIYFKKKKERN